MNEPTNPIGHVVVPQIATDRVVPSRQPRNIPRDTVRKPRHLLHERGDNQGSEQEGQERDHRHDAPHRPPPCQAAASQLLYQRLEANGENQGNHHKNEHGGH